MEICADKEKSERPLSPVLNNSHVLRKKILDRKKSTRTRVNLSERFKDSKSVQDSEFEFKKPISPASKLKIKSNVGFSTASGKSIHISPDAIKKYSETYKSILQADLNETSTVFRKDFSFISPVKSNFINKNKIDQINSYESDISDSQIVLAADDAVANLNEDLCGNNQNQGEFIGFTVDEYNWSYELVKRFNCNLNKLGEKRDCGLIKSPFQKCNLESEEEVILDGTLCNVFKDEDLSLLASVNADKENVGVCNAPQMGFLTASGKNITVSDQAWSKSGKISENLDIPERTLCAEPTIQATSLKSKTNGRSDNFSLQESTFKAFTDNLADYSKSDKRNFSGFSTARGGAIKISEEALKRSEKLLGNDFPGSLNENLPEFGMISMSEETITRGEKCFTASSRNLPGFATAGGDTIKISEEAWKKSNNVLSDELLALPACDTTNSDVTKGSSNTSYNSETSDSITKNRELSETFSNHSSDRSINTPTKSSNTSKSFNSAKKRLGVSQCKQIQTSRESLAKALLKFKDLDEPIDTFLSSTNHCVYSSTPLKETAAQHIIAKNKPNFLAELNITPVKPIKSNVTDTNSAYVLQEQTPGDIHVWMDDVIKECNALEFRLKVMEKRKKSLEEQQKFLESQNNARCRPVVGVLSEKKMSPSRITLKEAANGKKPGDVILHNSINFQNAISVHFNCASEKNDFPDVVYTEDGAIIIPNLKNFIGLSEIQIAFKAMIGVDPKLIPKGWIENHYKLIVWKLASMDRNLPNLITECLTPENVIQQLKYRYDREIDKAERSALHRILEKDDVPQKRMVLCVSNIIREDGQFDIELTDGWYCIRTVMDDLIKFQINLSKIVIGTKLVIQGAEILNCDGSHPLEVPDHVRLKINYNCTRRAVWYAKLGFQKNVKPFPISIDSIRSDGGNVGCVQIRIIRVYPLRYLEKNEKGKSVWRNRKAEDRRQQEWENERIKELDLISQKVRDDYEKELKCRERNASHPKLSDVKSSEVLCELLETCNDPENFKESLSSSQLQNVTHFQQQVLHRRNQELSLRVSNEISKLKQSKRQVHPVLKVLIIDQVKKTDRTTVLNVWNPTEEHQQLLKEGSNFYLYNVSPKPNGDLASTTKTYCEVDKSQSSNWKTFQRSLLLISALQYSSSKPLINEFDTVGTVVQISKQEKYQEAWVTDVNANLLHIKVFDGPHVCSLFDNVVRGQSLAFLNILFCEPRVSFAQGIANQCSVITSFPQQKFLQTGLEKHIEELPKDLSKLFDNCDKKIENVSATLAKGTGSSISASHLSALVETENFSGVVDDSLEDNTMIPSRLTTTDVAMSLIDTDQYFDNI